MLLVNLILKLLLITILIFSYSLSITNNAIYGTLSLIVILVAASVFLWIVGAEFLAMVYIIVYLGAVVVLFLFVVMMISDDKNIRTNNNFIKVFIPEFLSKKNSVVQFLKNFFVTKYIVKNKKDYTLENFKRLTGKKLLKRFENFVFSFYSILDTHLLIISFTLISLLLLEMHGSFCFLTPICRFVGAQIREFHLFLWFLCHTGPLWIADIYNCYVLMWQEVFWFLSPFFMVIEDKTLIFPHVLKWAVTNPEYGFPMFWIFIFYPLSVWSYPQVKLNDKEQFYILSWVFSKVYYLIEIFFFFLFSYLIYLIIFSDFNFFGSMDPKIANEQEIIIKLYSSNYLSNISQIGELLYTEYGLLVVISSFILLTAMIGAIVLTLRKNTSKYQNINFRNNKILRNSIALYKVKAVNDLTF